MNEQELFEVADEISLFAFQVGERRGMKNMDLVSVYLTLLVNIVGSCTEEATRDSMVNDIASKFPSFVMAQVAARKQHEAIVAAGETPPS